LVGEGTLMAHEVANLLTSIEFGTHLTNGKTLCVLTSASSAIALLLPGPLPQLRVRFPHLTKRVGRCAAGGNGSYGRVGGLWASDCAATSLALALHRWTVWPFCLQYVQ
jgi:hypothetical protein